MTFEGFFIGFALFCWTVLCGLLVFIWYYILFENDEPKQKNVIDQSIKKEQDIVTPSPKLRFKKPPNLNI